MNSEIRKIIDQSVTCEMRPRDESLESLEIRLTECKATLKRLNKAIKEGNAKFSEHVMRTLEKRNKRSLESMILFREMQREQGTTGPVRIM